MIATFGRVLAGLLACGLGLVAQQPAPTAETHGTAEVSPALAHVAAIVRRVGDGLRGEDLMFDRLLPGLSVDYQALVARRTADGVWDAHESRVAPSADQLCYFVPRAGAPAPRLVFCVRGDGVVAFSHNEQDLSSDGENRFRGDAVFGAGGGNGFGDFPMTPTRGNDGNLWLPISMLPTQRLRVTVRDEHDAAVPGAVVCCVPIDDEVGEARALPAGIVTVDEHGVATLVGMPSRGLGLMVVEGAQEFVVTGDDLRFDGDSVQLRIELDGLRDRLVAVDESAAIAVLKNINSAQAQCQASGVIDVDGDGAGEYGTFAELAGVLSVRGSEQTITPPVLSQRFANVVRGIVVFRGYCFAMVLPGKSGAPLGENARGGAAGLAIDADLAERCFCCYAWPLHAGRSGNRAFVVTAAGDVLACANADGGYSGAERRPALDAVSAVRGRIDGDVDRERWVVLD